MKNDYDRKIALICPTCATDQLQYDEDLDPTLRTYKCLDCGRELSHNELLQENSGRIDAAMDELKAEVMDDIKRDFSKLFK